MSEIPEFVIKSPNQMRREAQAAMEIPGAIRRMFYKDVKWKDDYGNANFSRVVATRTDAEVVTSEVIQSQNENIALTNGLHSPVLDIDIPAHLVPSSTPGHSHLYFDHLMTWRQYKRFLKALAKVGILENGYVKASIRRGHTAVRVPWLKKGETCRKNES